MAEESPIPTYITATAEDLNTNPTVNEPEILAAPQSPSAQIPSTQIPSTQIPSTQIPSTQIPFTQIPPTLPTQILFTQIPPAQASQGAPVTAVSAAPGVIDVDQDYVDDLDSAIGEDQSNYSTSLTSSIYRHSYEYGRRYHAYKDEEYIRPNDEIEVDRLDMMHHIFKVMQGEKLFEAPVPKTVQRVLDVGCGTGLWAMEFAEEHPAAEVFGVDLSPIQPNFVPPNVKFEIDDVEEDFSYSQPFDFIHCRYMAYAIRDWPHLVQQIYDHTKPGGYAEFTDYDLTYRSDDRSIEKTTLKYWGDEMPRAGRMMGREPCPGLYLEQWARDAGFMNITHKVYKIPIGPWPSDKHLKMLGAYNYLMVKQGAEAFSLRLFIKVLGWSYEEVQVLLAKVRTDLNDRKIHCYSEIHKVCGQKPGPGVE